MRPAEILSRRHSMNNESAPGEADQLPGDFAALFRQIGAANSASAARQLPPGFSQVNGQGLKSFLEHYQTTILLPPEFPAITQAFSHAVRGETRELIALDRQLAGAPLYAPFAAASRRVGQ